MGEISLLLEGVLFEDKPETLRPATNSLPNLTSSHINSIVTIIVDENMTICRELKAYVLECSQPIMKAI